MSLRLRRIVALALVGWLLVLGNSYVSTFASETQHDLEWTQSDGPGMPHDACGHGCVGHLSAHILAIEQSVQPCCAEPRGTSLVSHPDARALRWHSEPLSPPPNSLA